MKCPFCAETINDEAKVCRFCNRDLTGKEPNSQSNVLVGILCGPIAVVLLAELAGSKVLKYIANGDQTAFIGLLLEIIVGALLGWGVAFGISRSRP